MCEWFLLTISHKKFCGMKSQLLLFSGKTWDKKHSQMKMQNSKQHWRTCNIAIIDIDFLHSYIVSQLPGGSLLESYKFHNVSIIKAWNSQKDWINKLGCERFANDIE